MNDTDKILEEYYYGIGRMNTAFQTMEHVYKSMYFSFVEEHFKDDKDYKSKFRDILNKFETKLRLYYKDDLPTLNKILECINQSRNILHKRSFYIHSYVSIHKLDNEPEEIYLYKRSKENIHIYEVENGKFVINDDYKKLDLNELINITNEINEIGCKLVIIGHILGSTRQGNLSFFVAYLLLI